MRNKRGLSEVFIQDLQKGFLKKIAELIRRDATLDFQIRCNQVIIYYRGGKIWDIKPNKRDEGYISKFDKKYILSNCYYRKELETLPSQLNYKNEVLERIKYIPYLKQAMDEYFSTKKENAEREYQQHVVRENNHSGVANASDYFIVDTEYAILHARFDMVAFLWPSEGSKRKVLQAFKPKLVLIEMKFGDSALSGKSGLTDHLEAVDNFLSKEDFSEFKKEMITVFSQKRELELIASLRHNTNPIADISDKKPDFILLLAAHDPESSRLKKILDSLKPMQNAELKLATANFMGYSLYRNAIYSLENFKNKFYLQLHVKE